MKRRLAALVLTFAVVAAAARARKPTLVALPDAAPGIGFDDVRYSAALKRVLAPAGRSGRVDLVDPVTLAVSSIGGFSKLHGYAGGHDDGPTSVDEAHGRLYVTDRTARSLVVADPATAAIVARVPLSAEPDYVRASPITPELWVTEPAAAQIEIFTLGSDGMPARAAAIPLKNGPESLVFDAKRGRAYSHRWQRSTVVLDVRSRSVAAEWNNACSASRGIALDEARGWLFAACSEGKVSVLDVEHDGSVLSTLERGSGFDVMGYDPKLGHLYLAGSGCSCLVVLGVNASGKLSFLERAAAPASTHCAVADGLGHAWLCDPPAGRLWRFDDRAPASL
jgi:DNA-binding beta-propeller fold protein YncE